MAECELLADGWFDNDVIGMDDYLVKPAQPKALFGILLKWLPEKSPPAGRPASENEPPVHQPTGLMFPILEDGAYEITLTVGFNEDDPSWDGAGA